MIQPIQIRSVEIGSGVPKIIVPIVGKTQEAILAKAAEIAGMPIHMVEWRADFYDDVFDTEKSLATLRKLRGALGALPLLFTFRTKREGGEKEISMEQYTALNLAVAASGAADLIDVEIFSGDAAVKANIDGIHKAGARVVGSNHDFSATPEKDDIVSRLRRMQEMGADIPKIAVMPKSTGDVLTLLAATAEMHEKYADRPIITMSMSAKGVVSRLSCEAFGSAMTFGAAGQASAPGQIPVEQLKQALDILHGAM